MHCLSHLRTLDVGELRVRESCVGINHVVSLLGSHVVPSLLIAAYVAELLCPLETAAQRHSLRDCPEATRRVLHFRRDLLYRCQSAGKRTRRTAQRGRALLRS